MTLCKKHPSEPAVGVCASCLRDRLLGLQGCVTPRSPCAAPYSTHQHHQQQYDDHCGSTIRPPPSLFCAGPLPPQGKKAGFSVLSTLFGTPGGEPSPSGDRCSRVPFDEHTASSGPQRKHDRVPPSFSSWLAALFAVRCKRNRRPGGRVGSHTRDASSAGSSAAAASGMDSNKVELQQAAAAPCQRPTCRFQRYRGMSPGSEPEDEEEKGQQQHPHQQDGEKDRAAGSSQSASSSTTPTSPASSSFEAAHPTLPGPTPARAFWRSDAAAVKTGFAVCFSPLVRARPHHNRRARVVAGDVQKLQPGFRMRRHGGQHNHRLRHHGGGGGSAVKLCPNRSRKLVDMGRFP